VGRTGLYHPKEVAVHNREGDAVDVQVGRAADHHSLLRGQVIPEEERYVQRVVLLSDVAHGGPLAVALLLIVIKVTGVYIHCECPGAAWPLRKNGCLR
jgi:hypothetical protein